MNVQNLIRVAVAAAVGALVSLFAKWGMHLPAGWVASIGVAMTAVVTTLYLHIVATLEKRWPWISVLLGAKAKPAPAAPTGTKA